MSEPQQDAVWVFPPKKNHGPRIALIVLLVVLTLIVAGGLVIFLIPRDTGGPTPTPSPTITAASPSPAPSPSPSVMPTTAPTTAPTPDDPEITAFREQIGFRLSAAETGLDLIAQGGDVGATISKLQGDAQRLADAAAPASIDEDWRTELELYSHSLDTLAARPTDANALGEAQAALSILRTLVKAP